jgi:hypothetical protein
MQHLSPLFTVPIVLCACVQSNTVAGFRQDFPAMSTKKRRFFKSLFCSPTFLDFSSKDVLMILDSNFGD